MMKEKAEHYEFLARLQSPIDLYAARIGNWYYIFDSDTALHYVQNYFMRHNNESPVGFTRVCQNEYRYHGVARGKTELNAWKNACQNLLNTNRE